MSVTSILKGIGKKASSKVDDVFPSSDSPLMKGPFQRLTGKNLKDPMAFYQMAAPYHVANKYTVPLVAGGVAIGATTVGIKNYNQAKMGTVVAGDGLSGMTDGTIANASANVVTPYLKEMNSGSSESAMNVANNMQHNISTSGAEGDIVFALHNMR